MQILKHKVRSTRRQPRHAYGFRLVEIILIIAAMAFPLSPAQAQVAGAQAVVALGSVISLLRRTTKHSTETHRTITRKQLETAGQRESRVTHISICPRRVLMYVGEEHRLAPLPLDNTREPVQGVSFAYESSDKQITDVASDGTVIALASGQCFVSASAGQKHAKVRVEVRDGLRPRLTNAQWDIEHANDCTDPEQDPASTANQPALQSKRGGDSNQSLMSLPAPDDDPPPFVPEAPSRKNAIGHPRFSPDLALTGKGKHTDNQLGSDSFNLTIPIFGSGGRGVGVDLTLVYNSRVWTKDVPTNSMVFNYDVGWPAPGFRLNYGRIIRDYDVASGPGNYLLIEPDGTRTPLFNLGSGSYRSNDGRYLQFTASTINRLVYPDGTIVGYDQFSAAKLLPSYIRDIHGNSITISYVANCADTPRVGTCDCNTTCTRPPKQAIKQITDTLGRIATFYYDSSGKLAEIHVPGYGPNSPPDRVVAKFYYQTLTLAYDFGSITVSGVPSGNQVDVLRRVYFPDTGRGYVFDSYSAYGMFTHAAVRLGMTDALDGTEVAYTEYSFNTTGQLDDSPQYTERREWWLHKTDDLGNDTTSPAVYSYSRTSDSSTMTNTVAGPAGPNSVTTVMVSNNQQFSEQYGLLTEQRIEQGGVVKLKQNFSYDSPSTLQGLQRNTVTTTDDGSPTANQSQVVSSFGQYGRLMETIEYGFAVSGSFTKRRRTVYAYLDTVDYINLSMLKLVTDVTVWDTLDTNNNGNDVKIARTGFVYDTPDAGWEMQAYGFTHNCAPPVCAAPPGYDTKLVDRVPRGLVTKAQFWSDATTANADISFRHQYDIFGNELKAEVGCCSVKSFEFRDAPITNPGTSAMYWSVPFSATDGGGPTLQANYSYDFNTSFLSSQTDPNGLVTTYAPDAAMRLRTVTYPKLSTDTNANPTLDTFYADASNNLSNTDTLTYQSKFTYLDGATQKVQISNQWLDGAGRAIRQGSASGPTIVNFAATKVIYDDLGRLRKSTNPYNTISSDGNTSGLPNATVYDYDGLSRAVTVTLPDSNTVATSYNGAVTTVTDQAGRQRQSEVDGLGRAIRVTEMDASNQLTWDTTYGYDKNDNLTSVNQGGQTRAFKYDSLSRMTYERTPEQDATISDGTSTWSAHYSYTSFNAISTRQDARRVVTNYFYDGLNRLYQVGYTLPNPNPDNVQATATVNITYGSTAPKLGQVEEVKQTDSQNLVPWKENYSYDTLSRVSSKTVSFDNQAYAYTTGYGYNQAGQLAQMTYPSQRVVKYAFDSRGRLNTVGDGSLATKYVSSVGYNPSQQVGSIGLGNGVTENYGYSADRLQLTSQTATKSGNTLMSLTYNYVALKSRSGGVGSGNANTGQLMDITSSLINQQQRNESYNYDQVARLTQASGFYAQRNYTYDRWGNRTAMSGGSSQTVSYARDGNNVPLTNRISSVNSGPSYTYDATGDVTYDAGHSYGYDAESRAVAVDAGSTATYFYDAANRRVKKVAGGYTTYYVWEGSNVIAEYGNAPVGSAGTRFYHPDRLSNRMITDGSGVVKGTMDNLPFGQDGGAVGESEKHRFTSYERDNETSSDYAMNRQHSFNTGRFMRPDTVAGSIGDPQSLNRYAYTANDPINLIDPDGQTIGWFPILTGLISFFNSLMFAEVMNVSAGQSSIDVGGGGGGGTIELPWVFFGTRTRECREALRTAYGAGQAAVNRAAAGYNYVSTAANAHLIDPAILTAIGVRETGFRNIRETNASGGGRGIFQIDVGYHPGQANIAFDPPKAANYAAGLLEGRFSHYTDLGYGTGVATAAAVHDYNSSSRHTPAALRSDNIIPALDQSTTGHNYVSNVLNLAKHCFSNPTYFTDTPISSPATGSNGG